MNLAKELYERSDRDQRQSRSLRGDEADRPPQPLTDVPQEAPAGAAEFYWKDEKKLEEAFKGQSVEVLRQAQQAAGVAGTKVLDEPRSQFQFRLSATPTAVDEAAEPGSVTGTHGADNSRPAETTPGDVGRLTEGRADDSWRPWDAGGTETISLAPVHQGRTRGSLPIGLQLPHGDQLPYMFSRVGRGFSGGDMGHFRIQAVRSGSGYAAYTVAGLAVAGLLATVGISVGRRLRRGRAADAR
jgi:hypothetical protein